MEVSLQCEAHSQTECDRPHVGSPCGQQGCRPSVCTQGAGRWACIGLVSQGCQDLCTRPLTWTQPRGRPRPWDNLMSTVHQTHSQKRLLWNQGPRLQLSTAGRGCSPGDMGYSLQTFWFSQLEGTGCSWHVMGQGQEAAGHPVDTGLFPPQRAICLKCQRG